jgi:hypothetical protein
MSQEKEKGRVVYLSSLKLARVEGVETHFVFYISFELSLPSPLSFPGSLRRA